MKNVNKTYKFIYMTNYGWNRRDERSDFVFGNRCPVGYGNKFDMSLFFYNSDDRSMRENFTDKKTRRINRQSFLTGPANEANITLAMVKKFTYDLNQSRRRLTYLNKEFKLAETDKVKYPHGVNPGHYNVFNPDYYRKSIKHAKENLAIWKAKYQALKDQGVYTYLELMK